MNFAAARKHMVAAQLVARGIRDGRVLQAMRVIPRHMFVSPSMRTRAYVDAPIPIDAAQTISQPYMVARMSELLELRGGERVLEIGTGSGYQTAVLAELARSVFTIERHESLMQRARTRMITLGYAGHVRAACGDGNAGWPSAAPFDAIIVTAAAKQVPRPLMDQLAPRGRLVLPLGEAELQGLTRLRKYEDGVQADEFGDCRFVKLIGEYGW